MSDAAHPSTRHGTAARLGYVLLLLGAFGLIALCCATPRRGQRPHDRSPVDQAGPLAKGPAATGQADYDLGCRYLSGQGVTAYPLEAARLFERAAQAGHVPAMLKLADMLEDGVGVFRDPIRALTLYDAAGAASDEAAIRLCRLFAAGPVDRRDPARALRFCGKAAGAGDEASTVMLGLGMLRGHIPGDAPSAATLLSHAAGNGNIRAMYAMALLHLADQGVVGNPAEAYRWCRKAAEAGLPEAKALLAALSEEELPSAGNLAKAVGYYREAAAAGDREAAFALGSVLSKGITGQPDFTEARTWYAKAAEAGDIRAQFNLGLMELTGKGGPPNDALALGWMVRAAKQGDANARATAADMLLAGRGTQPDAREAFRWYRLAAGQGLARAQAGLAALYYEGRVVPRDTASALFWMTLASRGPTGDPAVARAAKAKNALEKQLTPEQLEQVRQRLADFAPAPYDPVREKEVLAAITFLPPSARGPGSRPTARPTPIPVPTPVGNPDAPALF